MNAQPRPYLSQLPQLPRGRVRIAIFVFVALVVGVAIWTIVGGLMARNAANRIIALADEILPADGNESVDSERIERAMAALDEASRELDGLDGWILPYRVAAPVIRFVPFRGGDASELGDLVDYAREIVNGGGPILTVAQEVSSGDYSASRADLVRLIAFIEPLESEVVKADEALMRAALKRESIDVDRLTSSVAARVETADRLFELIRAGTNAVLVAPEALGTATELIDTGQSLVDLATGSSVSEAISLGPRLLEDQRAVSRQVATLTDIYGGIRVDLEVLQPFLPLDLSDVDVAIDYGTRVLDGFGTLGDSLVMIQTLPGGGFAENPEDALTLGEELSSIAEQSLLLSRDLREPPDVPGIPGIPERAAETLEDLSKITVFLREFLGFEGRRVHLVLAQDEEELRATGGFLGAIWTLTTENGRLVDRQFASSYEVDGDLSPRFWNSAPSSFTLGLGSLVIPFRDLNWFADFPFAAERLRTTYARTQRIRPSTVIAINQSALGRVLDSLGPLEIGTGDQVQSIDGTSSRDYLRSGIDPSGADVPSAWDSQRFASYLLGNALLEALTAGSDASTESLASALTNSARSRDLLISSSSLDASGLFRKLGWDGSLSAFESDGFYVVESNVYAPKISHLIQREFSYTATVDGEGNTTGALSAVYRNPAVESDDACEQATLVVGPSCYWMVSRIYLPRDVTVSEAPSFPAPSGSIFSAFEGVGTDTVTVVDGADGLPFPVSEIAGLAVIEPGGTSEFETTYEVPNAATRSSDGVWRYDLLVRKQPGLHSTIVDVTVDLPEGSCVVGTEPAMMVSNDVVQLDFPLEKDELLTVWYGADAETCAREAANASVVSR